MKGKIFNAQEKRQHDKTILDLVTALVAESHGFVLSKTKNTNPKRTCDPRHILFRKTAKKIISKLKGAKNER